jgi:5'-nucleotidase/UDP-sugar diphosphatase
MSRALLGLLCALVVASCMPVLDGEDYHLAGQEVRITLLHTADIHSRLIPYDFAPLKTDTDLGLVPEAGPFGGATRIAAILKRERARADRVLHLDSGDCFQGAPIFNVNKGEAEFKFLSDVRLDAAVIGNHEFDAGALNFVQKARDFASFPLLAANYYWDVPTDTVSSNGAAQVSAPYTIRVVKGLRVGVIGMANLSSLNSLVEGGNSLQATPLEQNEALRAYVNLLRPVTDLVVVVSHLGLTEDQQLVLGYEAYYEYERAKPFIDRPEDDPTRWQILEWSGTVGDPKSVVRVRIPGVSGLDVILGGHLHVVLNPPQQITDPSGRKVLLAHSGAFAKYVGRLDLVVKVPEEPSLDGAELVSHDYRVFPLDSLWCDDAMRSYYTQNFWNPGQFAVLPQVRQAIEACRNQEDRLTTELLQPYILGMDFNLQLTSIFSYAPRDVARRSNSTGGDSPLGNIAADSMRKRRRVEAEMALTNSLGIRDNLYAGVVTQEAMFNVFPFENTINIMYLSGVEMQEMFDFVAERSAERGCVSQAQVSGARFVMDCAQVQINDLRIACDPANGGVSQCPQEGREGHAPWQCLEDVDGSRCWAHPSIGIQINGKPLDPNGTYRIAVNDYIAKGGSGFKVLKRNTTRIETGISLRDSLIGYMQGFCTCDDINAGKETSSTGERCGTLVNGQWTVDDQIINFCHQAQAFKEALDKPVGSCSCRDTLGKTDAPATCGVTAVQIQSTCQVPAGPYTGRCSCRDALTGSNPTCGTLTPQLRTYCENPTTMAVANVAEDGRIGRRVK